MREPIGAYRVCHEKRAWRDSDWMILTARYSTVEWVLHSSLEGGMKKTVASLKASPTAILPRPIFSRFRRSSRASRFRLFPFSPLRTPATQATHEAICTLTNQAKQKLLHKPWLTNGVLKSVNKKQKMYLSYFLSKRRTKN